MATKTLATDSARKTALEECELKIHSAFRRGLLATCEIAEELNKILSQELYTLKASVFTEYVTDFLKIDIRSYHRILAVSETVEQLKQAGLQLPANESQAAELARVDAPLLPQFWSDLIIRFEREERPLTTDAIREAINQPIVASPTSARAAAPARGAGIEVDMDDNGSAPPAKKQTPVQEGVLVLTEKGEAALNRIRKICGDKIAKAIEDGTRAMTERDIRNWAEFDDTMMKTLVYFINNNWTLNRAVAFTNKEIEDSTHVHDLILIANARGGLARFKHGRAKISVEME